MDVENDRTFALQAAVYLLAIFPFGQSSSKAFQVLT